MARGAIDWTGDRSHRWALVADAVEAQIAPVDDVLLEAAALRPGEKVLEVGSGRGVTTRAMARLLGSDGSIVALDISEELTATARTHPVDGAPVDFRVVDAQTAPLDGLAVDAVVSRFGIMFFEDPVAAFANLRSAVRPNGRFTAAVWQPRERSSLMERPISVARRVAADAGFALDLPSPTGGAFSLGDPDEAADVLTAAGWTDVGFEPHRLPMYAGGPGTPASAADTALTLGALHDALAEAPESLVSEVRSALVDDLATVHDGTGVLLEGAIAILTARAD